MNTTRLAVCLSLFLIAGCKSAADRGRPSAAPADSGARQAATPSSEALTMDTSRIHWYGHDAFRIDDAGKQVYIDPWKIPDDAPKADLILITHGHYDHYSAEDVKKLTKPGTKVVATADVAENVGPAAVVVKPGQTLDVGGFKVVAVPAYNVNKKFHPKASGWVGYVVTLSDGTTVYHAGDTDATPEMKALKVDIALLPVSGTYVMTAQEAADVANVFKPKVAIPMHYGTIVGTAADAETFKKAFKGATVIKTVEK